MKLILIFLAFPFVSLLSNDFSRWKAWKSKFNHPNYTTIEEEDHAFHCFKYNLREIERLNSIDTATYAENKFTYLCPDEFTKLFAGYRSPPPTNIVNSTRPDGKITQIMNPLDWREKGAVTPAKNQGHCGSCWAFSAVMTLEGAWKLAGNPLTSLSEQEVVGCSTKDDGCMGGIMSRAVDWVVKNGGIDSESDYPYVSGGGQHGTECDSSKVKNIVAKFKSTVVLNKPNEWMSPEDLYAALVKYGPLSIGVYSTPLQSYSGGIMQICQTGQTDHGVGLVGYGVDNSKSPPVGYWIVKNSWGQSWGEKGFMRVSMLYPNPCMINQSPVTAATV